MLTRGRVRHQYGSPGIADYSAPPFHVTMHPTCYPDHAPAAGRPARLDGGGLFGGAVALRMPGGSGVYSAGSGYGWLGTDPSDPSTWIRRPCNPSNGMIARLNFAGSG